MHKLFRILLILILLPVLVTLVCYFITPDPGELAGKNPTTTSFIQMRIEQAEKNGKQLKIHHRFVPYSHISQNVKDAVRISEDGGFFYHNGFDFTEIKEAIKTNIKERRFKRGASTITQQLAKNLYLSSEKTFFRKFKEAVLTIKLERSLSKQRIFSLYLNYIEFGDGIFGVEAASRRYFHKPAARLNPFESARLASIIPNPRKYHPNVPSRRLYYCSRLTLRRMFRYEKLSGEEYRSAINEFKRFFN